MLGRGDNSLDRLRSIDVSQNARSTVDGAAGRALRGGAVGGPNEIRATDRQTRGRGDETTETTAPPERARGRTRRPGPREVTAE